jgi:hypothetical protein
LRRGQPVQPRRLDEVLRDPLTVRVTVAQFALRAGEASVCSPPQTDCEWIARRPSSELDLKRSEGATRDVVVVNMTRRR